MHRETPLYLVCLINCPQIPLFPIPPSVGTKPPPTSPSTLSVYSYTPILPIKFPCMGEPPSLVKYLEIPIFPMPPIRGDKTPTDSPPIFYYFPTNFWLLFSYSHTPHQLPIIGDYPLSCKLLSDPLILHLHIRGDKTPTNSPSIFYYFPANFRPLFLYSHTPHQPPHPWGAPPGCKVPSNPMPPSVGVLSPPIPHQFPIGGGLFPTNSPPILGYYFYIAIFPITPPIHGDYPLGRKLPSNPFIPHVHIRGDKTPTNSPPIFYYFPTNFGALILYSHTPHHIDMHRETLPYFVCLQIPIYSPCPYPWG
jgi:hypothetical protein